jgi:hypothetical protein
MSYESVCRHSGLFLLDYCTTEILSPLLDVTIDRFLFDICSVTDAAQSSRCCDRQMDLSFKYVYQTRRG